MAKPLRDISNRDHADLEAMMGKRETMKVAYNTYLRKHDGSIFLVYGWQPIAEWSPDGLMLDTHDYHQSPNAMERLAWVLPSTWRFFRADYRWILIHDTGHIEPYYDGIIITPDSVRHTARSKNKLTQQIRSYMHTLHVLDRIDNPAQLAADAEDEFYLGVTDRDWLQQLAASVI